MISDDISDEELDLEVDVDEGIFDEVIFGVVEKSKIHQRTLKFWEVYVDDGGNLGRYLRQTYPDVEVAQFSLPRWNFEDLEIQRDFSQAGCPGETASCDDGPGVPTMVSHTELELPHS